MNEIRYLLSIKELLDESVKRELTEEACKKLDRERLRKLETIRSERKRAESIGAGLLLQLGLQEGIAVYTSASRTSTEKASKNTAQDASEKASEKTAENAAQDAFVQSVTVSQVLARLKAPMEPEYLYSEKGKPYFKEIPLFFSLSHSGEYVFCAFSRQELGADIQFQRSGIKLEAEERIVRRFFSESEQKTWQHCVTKKEQEQLFYKLWTRKEAYGKLNGEGIIAVTAVDVLNVRGIVWEEYERLDGYRITVCKRQQEVIKRKKL